MSGLPHYQEVAPIMNRIDTQATATEGLATALRVRFKDLVTVVYSWADRVPEGVLNAMLATSVIVGAFVATVEASPAVDEHALSEPETNWSPLPDARSEWTAPPTHGPEMPDNGWTATEPTTPRNGPAPRDRWASESKWTGTDAPWAPDAPTWRDSVGNPRAWNADQSDPTAGPSAQWTTRSWGWLWPTLTAPILALVALTARLWTRWMQGQRPAEYWTWIGLVAVALVAVSAWSRWGAWWPAVAAWGEWIRSIWAG